MKRKDEPHPDRRGEGPRKGQGYEVENPLAYLEESKPWSLVDKMRQGLKCEVRKGVRSHVV